MSQTTSNSLQAPQTLDVFHVEQLEAVQQRSHVAAPPDSITVAVLDEDILLGTRRNPSWCPIARALRRTLVLRGLPVGRIVVGGSRDDFSTVSIDNSQRLVVQYQFRTEGWIKAFDDGDSVQPRSFELVKL